MRILQETFAYILLVFWGIVHTLRLDPQVYQVVQDTNETVWVVMGIVVLAGASTLIGQSVVLFLNRVRLSRFLISLVTNGVIFLVSYAVWGAVVWLSGMILFKESASLNTVMRLVGLSTAPLVFGFFVLIPWMGPFIGKVLSFWSLVILVTIISFEFQSGFWGSLICVGLGWLITMGINYVVGRPAVQLRNKVFQMVTGSSLDATAQDILTQFSLDETNISVLDGGGK
jgi:hypothetical protein